MTMIRRAPMPDRDFLVVRNHVIRDARLSYRATGLLCDILSRPDDWETSADRLARARPDGEGRDAVRTALAELEKAGYLVREKIRLDRGRWSTVLTVHDTPQVGVTAGGTDDGLPGVGKPGTGNQASENQASYEDHHEEPYEDEKRGDDSGSLRSPAPPIEDPEREPSWREADRETWTRVLGGAVKTDGTTWKPEGTYTPDAFYDAFRQRGGERVRWPGRFLEEIQERDSGIEDWLIDQGLEVVPMEGWLRGQNRRCECGNRLVGNTSIKEGMCPRCRLAGEKAA